MKVFATLGATADTSTAQPGAIKLTPSSGLTASGVAVQMLDSNNNGIPLNSQIQYTTGASGIFDFNWKARYLQTESTVTAGEANASATVSLTYQ
jgi:type 1 fimbria pilin